VLVALGMAVRVGVGFGADVRVLVGLSGWVLPGVGCDAGRLGVVLRTPLVGLADGTPGV